MCHICCSTSHEVENCNDTCKQYWHVQTYETLIKSTLWCEGNCMKMFLIISYLGVQYLKKQTHRTCFFQLVIVENYQSGILTREWGHIKIWPVASIRSCTSSHTRGIFTNKGIVQNMHLGLHFPGIVQQLLRRSLWNKKFTIPKDNDPLQCNIKLQTIYPG